MSKEQCRFCHNELKHTFLDLGMSPLANSYIPLDESDKGQMTYPLHVKVCEKCWLVQLGEFESPKAIFSDYAYFSSYSSSWLAHAKNYVEHMMGDYGIDEHSKVVEIASNDGYLLQYFKEKGVPVLGIEPAKNVAEVAREKGIPTISEFFGEAFARRFCVENGKANLIIGNNVLAHVPNINDFVEGMRILLSDDGIITMEFPHLLKLIDECQFDTIYHEHFSYLSFVTVQKIFAEHSLTLFDVEELPTHGGSLRIFARRNKSSKYSVTDNVKKMIEKEYGKGMLSLETYKGFSRTVKKIKFDLLSTLINLKSLGGAVAAYGAAAKGNTLLNFCGIRREFIDFIADKNPHKQNTLLPGSMIPVFSPDKIKEERPDYILILPWNLKDEIIGELSYVREWGAKFIIPIPEVTIIS